MKFIVTLLLTTIGLVFPVHTDADSCTFQCGNEPCNTNKNIFIDEKTSASNQNIFTVVVNPAESNVTYTFVEQPYVGIFAFDDKTLNITQIDGVPNVDDEPTGRESFLLIAYTFMCNTAKFKLKIFATNINDNAGSFDPQQYNAHIFELARPGVILPFPSIKLTDFDRLSNYLTISLQNTDDNNTVPFSFVLDDSSFSAIGELTFEIIVQNPPSVDFERIPSYNLSLTVNDTQAGMYKNHVSTATLIITVEDLDDQTPSFNRSSYSATTEEGATGPLTIMPESIFAKDQDSLNVDVVYSISGADPCSKDSFDINETTGEISVVSNLDAGTCEIELKAEQIDNDLRYALTTLDLDITDVDSSCPVFATDSIYGRIDPDDSYAYVDDGVDLLILNVTDDDSEFNGHIQLMAEENQPFQLVETEGATNSRKLNFRVKESFMLKVGANYSLQVTVNATICSTVASASVFITVENLAPDFSEARYDGNIAEGTKDVNSIAQVSATSFGVPGDIVYMLKSATDGGEKYFSVNSSSGEINVVSPDTDAEKVEQFILFIEAQDKSWNPQRISFTNVYVAIEDINDNAPEFINTPYVTSPCIFEDYDVGRQILTVTATDADSNDVLEYLLKTQGLPFVVQNETGEIRVNKTLDVDNPDSTLEYTFEVTVTDGDPDHDQSVNVTICIDDVNDNPPAFDEVSYSWDLTEEEEIDGDVFQVAATDPDSDGMITYSLKDADSRFQIIDEKVGNISVNGAFDREEKDVYEVVVEAYDGKNTPSTTKVIFRIQDVNDNAPTFDSTLTCVTSTSLQISEDVTPGIAVCQFYATDADEPNTANTNITYSMQDVKGFGIFASGDAYQLNVTGALDREVLDRYMIVITASDAGIPQLNSTLIVKVEVTDVNDNAPVFDNAEIDIALTETASSFDTVAQLSVTDRDEKPHYLKYSSNGENSESFFVSPTEYGCEVLLKDELPKSSEPYIININVQNAYKPNLQESFSTIQLRVFVGMLQCLQIEPQNPTLTMIAPDGSSGADFVVIDMSVNYTCSGNRDVGDIEFRITRETYNQDQESESAMESNLFLIDVFGVLTGNSSATAGLYVIDLEAFNSSDVNNSISAYTTIELRLTKRTNLPPMFSATTFIVPTQILPLDMDTELLDLSQNATDDDYPAYGIGEVVFYKVEEDCSGCTQTDLFHVTPEGKLLLAVDLTILPAEMVNVTVRVEDRALIPLNDTSLVSLTFQLASNAPPSFVEECNTPVAIPEEMEENTLVCHLKATAGDNLPVSYGFKGEEPGNFTLNPQTGDIYTTRAFDYDSTDRQFELLVYARTSESGPEGFSVVNVKVTDINDHAPEFTQSVYMFEVDEDTNGTSCGEGIGWMIKATDGDATLVNQHIQYFIVGDSDDFEVDASKGLISKRRCIDAENTNYTSTAVTLTINATNPDAVLQPMGSTDVTFNIRDQNDNSPTFVSLEYVVRLPYLPPFQKIVAVEATDKDVGKFNGAVTYSFTPDEQEATVFQYFTIGAEDGIISTLNVTGYTSDEFDEKSDIRILVDARDEGSPPQLSSTPARITVIFDPVYYNLPYFYEENRQQESTFPENEVGCRNFTPPNISQDPAITVVYNIILVEPESIKFFLNTDDRLAPKVCTSEALDREQTKEYIITIQASSCNITVETCESNNQARFAREAVMQATVPDFSVVVIRFMVSDINDAIPEIQRNFTEGTNKYLIAVPDNTQYGASIFQVQATDADEFATLEYTLESEDVSLPNFILDPSEGSLQIQDIVSSYLDDANVDPTKEQAAYDVTFKVTDTMTSGDASDKASSSVQAKIKVLYIFEYAILVMDKPPTQVENEKSVLLDCLSDSLAFRLVSEHIEAHIVVDASAVSTVDNTRTDIWLYAIDVSKDGGSFVKYWDIKEKWDLSGSEVSKCSSDIVDLQPARPPAIASREYDVSMIVGIALLILACFIGVASVIMIIAVIYMWDDVKLQGGRQISRKLDMLMLTENDQDLGKFGLDNPTFQDDESVNEASITHVSEVEEEVQVCHEDVSSERDEEAQIEEPTYVNTNVDAEPLSPLPKGPEHYESQECVFEFPDPEYEESEDPGVSNFAHIRTKEYEGVPGHHDVPQSNPASVDIEKEQQFEGGAKPDDKPDDNPDDQSFYNPADMPGDKPDDEPNDEPGIIDDKEDDKSGDVKPVENPVDKTDEKPDVDPSDSPASDHEPSQEGSHEDVPPPPLLQDEDKNQLPFVPTTPKSVHFDLAERVGDRSSSSASSTDSTPLMDLGTGILPDFLQELEVTKL